MSLRHYSYECKVAPQDRPYKARPSRSQQLRNPKLIPKLHDDTVNALELKKGVASEELAKREAERKQKKRRSESRSTSRSGSYSDSDSRSGSGSDSESDSRSGSPESVGPSRRGGPPTTAAGASRRRPRSISPASASSSSRPHSRPHSRSQSPGVRSSSRSRSPAPRSRSPGPKSQDDPRRMKSSDFFERGPATAADGPVDEGRHGDSRRRRGESRSPGRGRAEDSKRRYRQRDNARDSRGSPPPDRGGGRERSLSPFSRRKALTQGLNVGR